MRPHVIFAPLVFHAMIAWCAAAGTNGSRPAANPRKPGDARPDDAAAKQGAALCHSGDGAALFERWVGNPLFPVDRSANWRSIHIANAAVLTASESPDGLWRLYVRGSGRFPRETPDRQRNYHDSIGLFTQEAESFSPYGPWKPYEGNPVLFHGSAESYDGKHLLDCCPVWGKQPDGQADVLYLYYKGVSYEDGGCIAGAYSADGGYTFRRFRTNPLKRLAGPCDVVCHQNRYYIFYGDAQVDPVTRKATERLKIYLSITPNPDCMENVPHQLAVDVGPSGSFDERSVHGARIFRLRGRWFMVYQASAKHFDYPERFHAATSTDLVHWTKVSSPTPLFMRGAPGQWDQGAIWFGEVFEHDQRLYMLYEGWGWEGNDFDRRRAYAKPGRSQVGIASVAVDRFLEWCGMAEP